VRQVECPEPGDLPQGANQNPFEARGGAYANSEQHIKFLAVAKRRKLKILDKPGRRNSDE